MIPIFDKTDRDQWKRQLTRFWMIRNNDFYEMDIIKWTKYIEFW